MSYNEESVDIDQELPQKESSDDFYKKQKRQHPHEIIKTAESRQTRIALIQLVYAYHAHQTFENKDDASRELFENNKEMHNYSNKIIERLISDIQFYYSRVFNSENEDDFKMNKNQKIKIDVLFINNKIFRIVANLKEIDKIIAANLKDNWTLARLDSVVLSILRCAIFEIVYDRSLVQGVIVVSEYTLLSKLFFTGISFSEKIIGFVNGILDKIARQYREGDKLEKLKS
jgi:transcription termination factor NusB